MNYEYKILSQTNQIKDKEEIKKLSLIGLIKVGMMFENR